MEKTIKLKLIKPAWHGTLKFLAGMLEEEKSVELIKELAKNYLETKEQYGPNDYNPHIDDLLTV